MTAVSGVWTYTLAVDPGEHTVIHVDPTGLPTTYVYPGSITSNGGGSYTVTYDASAAGTHILTETDDANASQTTAATTSALIVQTENSQVDFDLDLPGFIGG